MVSKSPATAPPKVPTRDRILFVTAELFRRQGYNGTGLKQVVAEAEAPFGSLYHHFPGGKDRTRRGGDREGRRLLPGPGHRRLRRGGGRRGRGVAPVFAGAAETLEATDYEDACPIATVALEVASTDDRLRRRPPPSSRCWTAALTERLGDRDEALAIIAALEGGSSSAALAQHRGHARRRREAAALVA